MLRVIKPKTRRARRVLDARAPKLHENVKKAVLLHGTSTSAVVKEALCDIHHLKKSGGCAVKMTRKNENIRLFEAGGETSLEFLAQKTDCSLFAFGSHSKKRPHNLVFGRMFDFHVLDMVELGILRYKSVKDLKGGGKFAPQVGSKPCFAFLGQDFESNADLALLKSILLDFFRGEVVDSINLAGLDRVFVCVAHGGKVFLRHCSIRLKKSGTRIPRIELIEVGPSFDFEMRRTRHPGADLRKEAMRKPKAIEARKQKNVSGDSLAGKIGRIYMPDQSGVDKMALRKMKGLKRERREERRDAAIGKAAASRKVEGEGEGEEGGGKQSLAKRQREA